MSKPPSSWAAPPANSPPFVHLHVHSNFSFLDGGSRIEELTSRAAELGQPALALTDHDGLYGAVRFAKSCKKEGIRPIFGAEIGAEPSASEPQDNRFLRGNRHPYHLLLLAETREGYANLCRLLSSAHLAVPERNRPPVVTREDLRTHSRGIICLTGCRRGEVGRLLDAGCEEEARIALEELHTIFSPQNVFVEIQHFGYEPRHMVSANHCVDRDTGFHEDGTPWALSCSAYCDRLLRLARTAGLLPVLTTNAHYAHPEGRDLHLVCRAAGRHEPLTGYPDPAPGARCLRPRAELEAALEPLLARHDGTSPLDTPALIAERCHVDLEFGTFHFPRIPIPEKETAYSLLAKRCFQGVEEKYRPVPPRAVELLEHELALIEEMGFAPYFLAVHDIVRWAREQGIACSGRGSAGNSLVCHVLGITASDPIRHNLLFERFLNPHRREMPDIDVDFCSRRRDEVIDHIYRTFGARNVAVVANVNTMSPRSAVRTVATALGFSPAEVNALAEHVPRHGDAAGIREYLDGGHPELKDSPLQDRTRYDRFLDLVERLDSFPLHLSTHLGGFVITDREITHYAPLQWAAKGVVVIQFNKDDVAALGLVKIDILGLKTHSAVMETVRLIRQRTGLHLDPYHLALNEDTADDPAAYEIISNGGSIGLFQLESAGQRNLATRLREQTFEDIIAAIALYRPGPLEAEMIEPFIDRRWGYAPVEFPHPAVEEVLADTYGVILYQEQVLQVARQVAGFSPAEADSLRRTMTRDKSREEMRRIGETFVHHALRRGVPENAAREVFRRLEGFAAYGFNKSHSVCFAVISYATAYLKAHYPAEFICALLNNQPMGFYTPRTVLNDARRFGLEVRPLDINLSGRDFTVEGSDPSGAGRSLRVGLSYLREMSKRALQRIEEEHHHSPFESFEDFYLRTRVEYPVAENLIRVGAFDTLEPDRTELLWRLPLLHDRLGTLTGGSGRRRGQLRAFTAPVQGTGLKKHWSRKDKIRTEIELLGLTVTAHPLELCEEELRELGVTMSHELPTLGDEVPVTVAGVYERAQNPWMRSGRRTMFLTLEDAHGLFECVIFETKLARCAPVVARATYFLIRGRLQNNRKRGLAIVAREVHDLEEVLEMRGEGLDNADVIDQTGGFS